MTVFMKIDKIKNCLHRWSAILTCLKRISLLTVGQFEPFSSSNPWNFVPKCARQTLCWSLSQVGCSLCDSLQPPGQRGQTLGLSQRTQPAAGPSTGSHRPEIPENTSPDYTEVKPLYNNHWARVWPSLAETILPPGQVARAERGRLYPQECDALQDPAEPAGVRLLTVGRRHEADRILQPQRALHRPSCRGDLLIW